MGETEQRLRVINEESRLMEMMSALVRNAVTMFENIVAKLRELLEDIDEDIGIIIPDKLEVKIHEPGSVFTTKYVRLRERLLRNEDKVSSYDKVISALPGILRKYCGTWFRPVLERDDVCGDDICLELGSDTYAIHISTSESGLACGPVSVYTDYIVLLKPSNDVLNAVSILLISEMDEAIIKERQPIPLELGEKAVEKLVDILLESISPPEIRLLKAKELLEKAKRAIFERVNP